jgi:DNA-nicking Smr family endonuclease
MATLTVAVQAQLQKIAMPPHLRRSLSNSSSTSESKDSAHLSDDGGSANPRKHKMEDTNEVQDKNVNDDYKPMKRTPHNMIERRYRNKLNDEIARLRDSVPSLRIMSKSARGEDVTKDREDLHGLTPAHKLNKATVCIK